MNKKQKKEARLALRVMLEAAGPVRGARRPPRLSHKMKLAMLKFVNGDRRQAAGKLVKRKLVDEHGPTRRGLQALRQVL